MKNLYFLGILLTLLAVSCAGKKASVSEMTATEKMLSDEDFQTMISIDEEIKKEIITGRYRSHKDKIYEIVNEFSLQSSCEILNQAEVRKQEYLKKYFERACLREEARQRFIDKHPNYIKMSPESRLELREMMKKRLELLTPDGALEISLDPNY